MFIVISMFALTSGGNNLYAVKQNLIYEYQKEDYSIELNVIDVKYEEDGSRACAHFSRTGDTDTLYYTYGHTLQEAIVDFFKTTDQCLTMDQTTAKIEGYIDLKLHKLTDKELNLDSILQETLMKAFNIQVTPKIKKVAGYELYVVEDSRLEKRAVSESKGTKITFYKSKIKFDGTITLESFAKNLTESTALFVEYYGDDSNYYDLKLKVYNSVEKSNKNLKKYGLELTPKEFEIMFYDIKSSK